MVQEVRNLREYIKRRKRVKVRIFKQSNVKLSRLIITQKVFIYTLLISGEGINKDLFFDRSFVVNTQLSLNKDPPNLSITPSRRTDKRSKVKTEPIPGKTEDLPTVYSNPPESHYEVTRKT